MSKQKPNIGRKKYKKMPIEDRVRMVENLYIHFPRKSDSCLSLKLIDLQLSEPPLLPLPKLRHCLVSRGPD